MVTDEENLTDMVWANADRFGDAISLRRRVAGSWVDLSTVDFVAGVRDLAKGFIAAGLRPGDRVAVLSATRSESALVDFATWAAGCVAVTIDGSASTPSPDRVEWILADSGARAVVVENDADRRTVRGVVDRLAEVVRIWQLDGDPVDGVTPAVEELTALGADVPDEDADRRRLAVCADDTATLVYTSGADGAPKGNTLTHRDLLDEVRTTIAAYPRVLRAGNSMLMYLPRAHVFARTMALCCVYSRTTLGHIPDLEDLLTDLGTFRPAAIVAVPRVFERIYDSAKAKAHLEGRGRIFDAAAAVAVAYGAASAPGGALRIRHAVADKLVYTRLRAVFGGRCTAAVAGSPPLSEHLTHFFRGIGIPVYPEPTGPLA